MKRYVLDACALIALFQKEDGAEVIENILIEAAEGICSVSIHRLNLLEVYYGYLRADGETVADAHITAVESSCIHVINEISSDLMKKAGKIKTTYHLSLADAVAVAQAAQEGAVLITSDHHELDSVDDKKEIKFLWIR
jgi:predicted nucleic acid-binding protein